MQLTALAPALPARITPLTSLLKTSAPTVALDTFVTSSHAAPTRSFKDNVKAAAVLGGIGLVGGALGVYAGLSTGILAGLAGTIAGAAGGASLATAFKSQPIIPGMVLGALGGAILGASTASPLLAVGLGIAGASLPFAAFVVLMKGAS